MVGWAKIKSGAKYAAVSDRTFRDWIKSGLRHVRLPSGTILVKLAWIDEYLEGFEIQGEDIDLDSMVNEICGELTD